MSTSQKEWILLADISNVGKKRLRVLEKSCQSNATNGNNNNNFEHSVDAQALEQILNVCSSASVKEVEQLLSLSSSSNNNNKNKLNDESFSSGEDDSLLLSKVLLRYAILSDAFRREQEANDILTNALETSLKAVEAARDELDEVRAERDALKQALSFK